MIAGINWIRSEFVVHIRNNSLKAWNRFQNIWHVWHHTLVQIWKTLSESDDFRRRAAVTTHMIQSDHFMACWKAKWLNCVGIEVSDLVKTPTQSYAYAKIVHNLGLELPHLIHLFENPYWYQNVCKNFFFHMSSKNILMMSHTPTQNWKTPWNKCEHQFENLYDQTSVFKCIFAFLKVDYTFW